MTTAAASLCMALSISYPRLDVPGSSILAVVRERRADAELSGRSQNLARASDESLAALSLAPASASAWLRIAYIEHARSGRFNEAALTALENSFTAAPYGPDVTGWRVLFMFDNWSSLTPSLRRRAMDELVVASRYRGAKTLEITRSISDPAGALAARMATAMARAQDPREEPAAAQP